MGKRFEHIWDIYFESDVREKRLGSDIWEEYLGSDIWEKYLGSDIWEEYLDIGFVGVFEMEIKCMEVFWCKMKLKKCLGKI